MTTPPNHAPQRTAVETHATTPDEGKHSFNWGWIMWPVVVLLVYSLSIGPVLMLDLKNRLPRPKIVWRFYYPVRWAYFKSPILHKPLGMYLHLWVPDYVAKNGDLIEK